MTTICIWPDNDWAFPEEHYFFEIKSDDYLTLTIPDSINDLDTVDTFAKWVNDTDPTPDECIRYWENLLD